MNFNLIAGEALWFLAGLTDLKSLRKYQNKPENSHTIWTDDFNKFWDNLDKLYGKGNDRLCHRENECGGRIYGKQWRERYSCATNGYPAKHDQIQTLLDNIVDVKDGNPRQARRLIVDSWNPYDHTVGEKIVAALSACHDSFQCIVRGDKLDLRFHCRSNDTLLG
jgi:thymidylate synthase